MSHMQAEGVCLKYPEDLGIQLNFSQDLACQMLLRATGLSTQVPFQWTYIDRPAGMFLYAMIGLNVLRALDGQVLLIFVPNQMTFPIDGIRYQDQEQRYTIPVGSTRVCLSKMPSLTAV